MLFDGNDLMKKILLVADVSNLYHSIKRKFGERAKLNYLKFVESAIDGGELVKAIAYGVEVNNQVGNFRTALEHRGFETKFKKPKVFASSNDRKADQDIQIVVDIMEFVSENPVDVVVIGSADGDFAPCVRHLREKGIEVWILATGISYELRDTASRYGEITEEMLEC